MRSNEIDDLRPIIRCIAIQKCKMGRNQQLALTKPARKHLPAQQKAGYLAFRDSSRAAQFGHTVAINYEKWFLAALHALDGLKSSKTCVTFIREPHSIKPYPNRRPWPPLYLPTSAFISFSPAKDGRLPPREFFSTAMIKSAANLR